MISSPALHDPVRLLQVFNQYLEPGGEEVWVNQMLRLGGEAFTIHDLRFHSGAWMGRGAPSRFKQAALLWDHPQARERLRQEVADARPDALLFHNLIPVASLGMYEEARKLELPVIQYIHNFRPFSPSGTMWMRGSVNAAALSGNPWPEVFARAWESSFLRTFVLALYQKRLLSNGNLDVVKRWIAVSDFMRDKFIEGGIPADRVVTLRHCWQANPDFKAAEEGAYYLFLGRLVPEKGISTLLDAWELLEKRLGPACPRLIIAGSGSEEARTHARANRMNRVTCVGFVTGTLKEDLVRSCRGLIAPSIWWEPLGLIVHEAYDCARPVLAARSGGLTETVIEGVTGYLHNPDDAVQLADDVERLEALGSKGRAEMGQRGREWLVQNASPKEWRERFVAIVREAVR
jgi:glycosyltransferase involved in cell wall biosynthesis